MNTQHLIQDGTILGGLDNCPLSRKTAYGVKGVSQSMLSIARYSGGCMFNGSAFTYIPATDELIRDDVLKWKVKNERATSGSRKSKPIPK